ncbi:MAG: aldo/keto reductase [Clostridia bacterium]|nr:aldo/keto reductase [Clostridia bacterium]
MQKRKFDNLGVEASVLGFGCMRFPTVDGKIDEAESERMLDRAMQAGVTYYDTAYPYHDGDSEPFVGKALKKYNRSSFFLATKLPIWKLDSLDDVERIFNDQLKRLDVDYVDFYLLHAVDKDKWQVILDLGILDYCDKLKAEGKIRYFGFSFHDEYEVFEEIISYRKWDFVQLQLNYIDIGEQAGARGVELCNKLNVPIIVMEPVKGGTLAKLPDEVDAKFKAKDPEASTSSWAMRWCGTLPGVKVILSGMSTMEQVDNNLKTFGDFKELDESEKALVQDVADTLNSRMRNGCTDCRYCMPCPAGVNIPANFARWNRYAVYGNAEDAKSRWASFKDEEKAHNCIECGACETKCPQKINIREDLKALQTEMDAIE